MGFRNEGTMVPCRYFDTLIPIFNSCLHIKYTICSTCYLKHQPPSSCCLVPPLAAAFIWCRRLALRCLHSLPSAHLALPPNHRSLVLGAHPGMALPLAKAPPTAHPLEQLLLSVGQRMSPAPAPACHRSGVSTSSTLDYHQSQSFHL